MLQRVIKLVFGRIECEIGRPSTWNLPDPDFPVWAERPTLSDGFFSALGEGRIQVRGEIASCDGKLIRFVDGSVSEVDVIVWAPLAEQQAHWLVEVLQGTIELPSRAVQLRQAVDVARILPVFCNAYVLDLRRDFR